MDKYDRADILAIIGMACVALDMNNMAPTSLELIGEGGLGLAAISIFSKFYIKYKSAIVTKVDDAQHKAFGTEHTEGDEEIIEDVIDVAIDITEDLVDDGVINNSND